jgi:hypothetical protein
MSQHVDVGLEAELRPSADPLHHLLRCLAPEFAGRINSSRKAIPTIQKLHRTICVSNQSAHVNAEERTGPFVNR